MMSKRMKDDYWFGTWGIIPGCLVFLSIPDNENGSESGEYVSMPLRGRCLQRYKLRKEGRMKKCTVAAVMGMVTMGVCAATSAFAGPKVEFGEDGWLQLSLLGQVHYSYMEDAEEEHDFYLRRGRFIVSGQVMDGVKVFVETDYPNAGKNGVDADFKIQDAWMDVQLFGSKHWVKGGLILLPFSFENRASAGSLLGIDYNGETIKFVNDFIWRDYGAALQGSFADRIGYKVGIFDGYDDDNKYSDADLRFTGRVDVAVLGEVPTGWFYSQDPISDKTYLYVGGGFDHQGEATLVDDIPRDNEAWVADFQSGFKLSDMLHLTVNGAWYNWDNSKFDGNTAFVEGGLRYEKIMGTLKYSYQDPDGGEELNDYTAGLHYYLKGHNARAGVEYRWGDSSDWWLVGIQFLL